MKRREFLKGTSALAIISSKPAFAGLGFRESSSTQFNGGRSQGQSSLTNVSGDFPFINLFKSSSDGFRNTFSGGQVIGPDTLNAKGYPLSSVWNRTYLDAVFFIPNQTSRAATPAHPFVTTWIGNATALQSNVTITTGSFTPVLNGYGFSDGLYHGRYEWYPTTYPANGAQLNTAWLINDTSNNLDDIRVYFKDDESPAFLAGTEFFSPQFKSVLKRANFGAYRFMDWLSTNVGIITTWASRKSQGYVSWVSPEFRANLYGGVTAISNAAILNASLSSISWSSSGGGTVTATTTVPHGITIGKNFPVSIAGASPSGYNSTVTGASTVQTLIATATGTSTFTYPLTTNPGTETVPGTYNANVLDYNLTIPGTYVWKGPNGNYTGTAPVDKQTMHIGFDQNAMLVQNFNASATNPPVGNLTITGYAPLTFAWPSSPLSNGDIVNLSLGFVGGNWIQGVGSGVNYYVVNASGSGAGTTFQISLTSRGSAISSSDTSGGSNIFVTRPPTLNINSSGKVPLVTPSGSPFVDNSKLPTNGGSNQSYGTVVFDGDFNVLMLTGANASGSSIGGIDNGVPIEVIVQLCAEIGMHPYFSIPSYALDPATDFATGIASYVKNSGPSWMVPRFEPGNEVWNTAGGIVITPYAINKSFNHWGLNNYDEAYGKWLSVLGQGVAAVYGLGNLGTKYHVMVGSQYLASVPGPSDPNNSRITAAQYVAQAAAPQAGYSKVSAASYTSVALAANYYSPVDRGMLAEYQLAWQYYVTNAGNPTAQMANLNAYVDSALKMGGDGLPFVETIYSSTTTWAQQFGINGLMGYEGGYSPDLVMVGTSAFHADPYSLTGNWNSAITGASKATSAVFVLATTNQPDGTVANPQSGNPAKDGMLLVVQGIGGITQFNCLTSDNIGAPTLTIGQSIISWPSNILIAGQGIQFRADKFNANPVPSNIQTGVTYYVLAAGLSSSQFQISDTPGGSAKIMTGTGTTFKPGMDTGWVVTDVSGNIVRVGVNSSSFSGTYMANTGTAYYSGSTVMVNNFRLATQQLATDLQAITTDNYNIFAGVGGTFPSQYLISASGNIWPPFMPDVWHTPSKVWNAIEAYNTTSRKP